MDAKTKAKALDKLRMLNGDAPYDGGSNICRGDGYFAQSIVRDFGMSLDRLEKVVGYRSDAQIRRDKDATIKRLRAELKDAKDELAAIKRAGRVVDRIEV